MPGTRNATGATSSGLSAGTTAAWSMPPTEEEVDRIVVEFEGAFVVMLTDDRLADSLALAAVASGCGDCGEVDLGAVLV